MNNNRSYRIIAVIALFLGVVGITLGYAAFTSTLVISPSAEVTPNTSNFSVVFSSSSSSLVTSDVEPSFTPTPQPTGLDASDATINNTGNPTISNLHATFTEPGQSVSYRFYAYNAGQYIAYLNAITFSGSITCTAKSVESPATPATQSLVNSACNGISISVKVGSEDATTSSLGASDIDTHSLSVGGFDQVDVVITYAANSQIADGDFDVTLPSITLTYDSVNK